MSRSDHARDNKQPRRRNTLHRSARTQMRSAIALGDYDRLPSWQPIKLTRRVVN